MVIYQLIILLPLLYCGHQDLQSATVLNLVRVVAAVAQTEKKAGVVGTGMKIHAYLFRNMIKVRFWLGCGGFVACNTGVGGSGGRHCGPF